MRRTGIALALTLVALPARAQTSTTLPHTSRLTYLAPLACPSEQVLRNLVAGQTSTNVLVPQAPARLTVTVSRRTQQYEATAELRDEAGVVLWTRPFAPTSWCSGLVEDVAVYVSAKLEPRAKDQPPPVPEVSDISQPPGLGSTLGFGVAPRVAVGLTVDGGIHYTVDAGPFDGFSLSVGVRCDPPASCPVPVSVPQYPANFPDAQVTSSRLVGVGAGGALGGTLGLLAGIGALAIPGFGPFIAAGPILAALSGAAAGAALGGITGALIGMGIPEMEARQYEGKIKSGSILISVHVEDAEARADAKNTLERHGATDIVTVGKQSVPSKQATPVARTSDHTRLYPTARQAGTPTDLRQGGRARAPAAQMRATVGAVRYAGSNPRLTSTLPDSQSTWLAGRSWRRSMPFAAAWRASGSRAAAEQHAAQRMFATTYQTTSTEAGIPSSQAIPYFIVSFTFSSEAARATLFDSVQRTSASDVPRSLPAQIHRALAR